MTRLLDQLPKGPWKASSAGVITAADGKPVAFVSAARMTNADVMANAGTANAITQVMAVAPELVEALEALLAEHPVFRSKPIGDDGSQARHAQQSAIAAEDRARAVLAKIRGER